MTVSNQRYETDSQQTVAKERATYLHDNDTDTNPDVPRVDQGGEKRGEYEAGRQSLPEIQAPFLAGGTRGGLRLRGRRWGRGGLGLDVDRLDGLVVGLVVGGGRGGDGDAVGGAAAQGIALGGGLATGHDHGGARNRRGCGGADAR